MRNGMCGGLIAAAVLAWSSASPAADNPQAGQPAAGDTQHIGSEPPMAPGNPGTTGAPASPIGASGDTMPAKYSAKNAADDKLPLGSYRLKHLTDDQRHAIYRAVRGAAPGGGANIHPQVGALVPSSAGLAPLPADVTSQVPDTRDLKFTIAQDKVVLIDPVNMMVVGVLGQAGGN
jgi:hypothetical protein